MRISELTEMRLTVDTVVAAINACYGHVARAAERLGVSPQILADYLDQPAVLRAIGKAPVKLGVDSDTYYTAVAQGMSDHLNCKVRLQGFRTETGHRSITFRVEGSNVFDQVVVDQRWDNESGSPTKPATTVSVYLRGEMMDNDSVGRFAIWNNDVHSAYQYGEDVSHIVERLIL